MAPASACARPRVRCKARSRAVARGSWDAPAPELASARACSGACSAPAKTWHPAMNRSAAAAEVRNVRKIAFQHRLFGITSRANAADATWFRPCASPAWLSRSRRAVTPSSTRRGGCRSIEPSPLGGVGWERGPARSAGAAPSQLRPRSASHTRASVSLPRGERGQVVPFALCAVLQFSVCSTLPPWPIRSPSGPPARACRRSCSCPAPWSAGGRPSGRLGSSDFWRRLAQRRKSPRDVDFPKRKVTLEELADLADRGHFHVTLRRSRFARARRKPSVSALLRHLRRLAALAVRQGWEW